MTIPSFKLLKKNASECVAAADNSRQVVLIYSAIIAGMALLVTAVNLLLDGQIAQTGGLGSMGLRTMLTTVQSVLPILQSILTMCLEIGYLAAMLRISRRQYVSGKTLRLGFDRFWLTLRCNLLQAGFFMGICMAALWISAQVFLLSPFSDDLLALMEPLAADPSFTVESMLEGELYFQLLETMIPLLVIFGLLYAALAIPLTYSFRMIHYVIIDKPGLSAMAVLRESRKMMKGSRRRLFRLDMSLWWWYAVNLLLSLVCYSDMLLESMGIPLPLSADMAYLLSFALYLAGLFAAYCLLRNRVEVVYAQAYDALKPREKNDGVVLGNIFQM